jgi:HAD superfamily hydrolase (TIGR01509 family)
MCSKIEAVIFDMDGVLIDAKDWHYEALNRALGLFGVEINRYDHLVTYDGLPTKKKLEMLSLERGFPQGLHNFLNDLKQIYTIEMVTSRCRPNFNHEYALSKLRMLGYRLAVCSNSVRASVEAMMQHSNLLQYLDFFLSNQDVEKSKPHPDMYLKAMTMLGLEPDQCMIVEDNPHGIAAAKASGAHVMEVATIRDVNFHNLMAHVVRFEARS